jgi:hypothetical protein
MRLHPAMTAAAGLVAAGFIVTGCSPSSSSSAGSPSSAAPASSAPQSGAKPASSPSSQQGQAAGSATCQATQLRYALGTVSGTSAQRTQVVDLTNKGAAACTLQGFPGVDLSGIANGQQNYTWSLERQSARYAAVTLQPGQTGHFSLVYLPDNSTSGDMTVSKLVITPPNDYTQAEVTWNQSVLLQDGATRPGTYVTPVVAGS